MLFLKETYLLFYLLNLILLIISLLISIFIVFFVCFPPIVSIEENCSKLGFGKGKRGFLEDLGGLDLDLGFLYRVKIFFGSFF